MITWRSALFDITVGVVLATTLDMLFDLSLAENIAYCIIGGLIYGIILTTKQEN